MNSDKYLLYAVAILSGGAIALWAGVSPFLLLFLACPLMMFFMMRVGMGGDRGERDSAQHGSASSRSAVLDESRERIDRP